MDGGDHSDDDITPRGSSRCPDDSPVRPDKEDQAAAKRRDGDDHTGTTTPADEVNTPRRQLNYSAASHTAPILEAQSAPTTNAPPPPPCLPARTVKSVRIVEDAPLAVAGVNSSSSGCGGVGRGGSTSSFSAVEPPASPPPRAPHMVSVEPSFRLLPPPRSCPLTIHQVLPSPQVSTPALESGEGLGCDSPSLSTIAPHSSSDSTVLESVSARSTLTGGCSSPLSPGRPRAWSTIAGRQVSHRSSDSHDREHSSNPSAGSRRCYVPSRGARLYSLSSCSDGGRSHLIPTWSTSSKPTTPASQATTRLPHSSLRAVDSRHTRESELSFTSETGSATPPPSAWLTPGGCQDDPAHHRRVSAPPPPPPGLLGALTLNGGAAPQLLQPYRYAPPRAMAQSPMLTPPPPTLPPAPQLRTLNPFVLQRRLSDTAAARTLPAVVTPSADAVSPTGAAAGRTTRSPATRAPLLAGSGGLAYARRGASRTPPVAVLVPLAAAAAMRHTPTPPPPTGRSSSVPTPPLDRHDVATRVGSFASVAVCRDRSVSPFSELPSPAAGGLRGSCASVSVTPLLPSLTQLHRATPPHPHHQGAATAATPLPPRSLMRETPPSISLEAYVADLTPPTTSVSLQGRLLGAAVALCAVPLAAVVLLLGLHCWAVTTQWRTYAPTLPPPRVGGMQQSSFALLLGVLLAALVMGVGCGAFIYAVLYRQGVRYQVRAFAACARLARALAEAEGRPARCSGAADVDPPLFSAREWSSDTALGQFVLRWHAEVGALLGALTCPIVEAPGWPTADGRPHQHTAAAVTATTAHTSTDRPTTGGATHTCSSAVGDTGSHAASAGNPRVLTPTRHALSPTSRLWCTPMNEGRRSPAEARLGQRGTSPGFLDPGVLLSGTPPIVGDTGKAREAVTVVVCRLHLPAELDPHDGVLTVAQLESLQLLCDEFHRRLRTVPRSRFAVVTEVGLTEVAFSLNTLYPMPSLVAGPEAVALALAAQATLSEWVPSHGGQALAWGVAVHRLSGAACLCYVRRDRRAVSFGGGDYDVARRLAELAALCGYGALCHGNFLEAAASCEPQSLAVDFVMDRRQETCVVYQLHRGVVQETLRQHMSDAIASMRAGDFHVAVRQLSVWRSQCAGDRGAFPPAAAHLLYIAELLGHAGRLRLLSSQDDLTTTTSAMTLSGLENVEGWALTGLLSAYCRPPPVWEEELEEAPPSPSRGSAGLVKAAAAALPPGACTPPRTLRSAAAAVASRLLRRWAGGDGGGGDGGSPTAAANTAVPQPPHADDADAVPAEPPLRPRTHESPGPRILPPTLPPRPPLQLLLPPALQPCSNALSSGNVLEAPLSPLSPVSATAPADSGRTQRGSAAVQSDVTPEPAAATTALSEAPKVEKAWAALALPTNPDQSILTFHATGPRLFSASCSLAGSVLADGGLTTPLPPCALRTSHPEGRRGRLAPVLLLTPEQDGGDAKGGAPAAHVRRDSRGGGGSGGGGGGGSVSQAVTDVPAMGDTVASRTTNAASASQTMEALTMPHTAHNGGRESVSIPSASSAPLSSSTRRRGSVSVAPSVATVLPLFAEVGLKLEGRGELTEATSELDLSVMSVVQLSRSRRSQRAPPQMSSVVCTCAKRIDGGTSDAVMVLRGFHPDGFLVAVKRADVRSPKQVRLLRNEVELLADMHHDNIVRAISSWADAEAEYLAMEHACETLADVLHKFKALLPRVVRFYARELLTALVYLHGSRGVVHRDLSPKNVIITTTTECSHVKLIDFGRAVVLPQTRSGSSGAGGATLPVTVPDSTGAASEETHVARVAAAAVVMPVAGTPLFMSPEACRGTVHPANDIWSLGVMVHLCLTGSYPYPPDVCSDAETFVADVAAGRVVPSLASTSQLRGKARQFVEQCLQLEHGKRPSAAALLHDGFVKR